MKECPLNLWFGYKTGCHKSATRGDVGMSGNSLGEERSDNQSL